MSAAEDSFRALRTAIASVIASACADPNDGIAWAAERSVHMLTASQIIDDFLDPEVAAAEKRGAIKALRAEADRIDATVGGNRTIEGEAMRSLADRIESGEVTP